MRRNALRLGLLLSLFGIFTLSASTAEAARKKGGAAAGKTARAGKTRVVAVLPFGGPLGNAGRGAIFVGLRKRPEVSMVPIPQTDAALKLLNPDPSSAADFQSAANALEAAALIQGAANKKTLIVRVYSGDTGTMLIQQTFPLKNGNMRTVVATAWPKLKKAIMASRALPAGATPDTAAGPNGTAAASPSAPALPPRPSSSAAPPVASTRPPPRPETEPAPSTSSSSTASRDSTPANEVAGTPSASSGAAVHKTVWLDVSVYGGAFRRSFTYTDDVFGALSYYKLNGAPAIGAHAEVFPFAPFTESFAGNIGIVGRYESAVGLKSVTSDGTQTFNTVANELEGGLKVRVPYLVNSDASLAVTYDAQTFSFGGTATSVATVPNVAYKSIHALLETRLGFGSFAVFGGVGYFQVFGSGEISTERYFPRLKVGGVEGNLGFAYAFTEIFEARIQGQYRHYFYSMNPEVGDDNVAGGALDQYISGTVSIAMRLR
jgi:hypothetical protein